MTIPLIAQTFTAPTTAPARGQPRDTFAGNVTNRLNWQATNVTEMTQFRVELNATIAEINATAGVMNDQLSSITSLVEDAEDAAAAAALSAGAAAASAASALNAPGTSATSTTSTAIGTGSKTLTIQTGKAFSVGQPILIARTSNPASEWMFGQITAHNSGTGSITISVGNAYSGSGTYTDWTLSLSTNPAADGGISTVTTTSGNYTFDATKRVLIATPTDYGYFCTLVAATSVGKGGVLYVIKNNSGFHYGIKNSAGTLLGFVPPYTTAEVFCEDNAAAAGPFTITNLVPFAPTMLLDTTAFLGFSTCSKDARTVFDMDGDIEIIVGYNASGYPVAVARKKSTAAVGSPTVIRSANCGNSTLVAAAKHSATQLLVVSCTSGSTALEAVIVTLNTSTLALTPNTAATATLGANINGIAPACGLMPLPGAANNFSLLYNRSDAVGEIRNISVSGTSVTISSATTLDAGNYLLQRTTGDKAVVACAASTTALYTKPYTFSGTAAPSAGTGTTTSDNPSYLYKMFEWGGQWGVIWNKGGRQAIGIISLSGTTTSISVNGSPTASGTTNAPSQWNALVLSSTKLLLTNGETSQNTNIVTNTSGTVGVGTAIDVGGGNIRIPLHAAGNSAFMLASNSYQVHEIDWSGASPVLVKAASLQTTMAGPTPNEVLSKHQALFWRTDGIVWPGDAGVVANFEPGLIMKGDAVTRDIYNVVPWAPTSGSWSIAANDLERVARNATCLMKFECAA